MKPWKTKAGSRIYAIGDIHGRFDLLGQLLSVIRANEARLTPAHTQIYCVGDYINRGPASSDVLSLLADPPPIVKEWKMLLGNHEKMLLDAFDGIVGAADAFVKHGGRATLASYGVVVPLSVNSKIALSLVSELRERMPPQHLSFLRGLHLTLRHEDYFFCHAGARPGVSLEKQIQNDLLNIRHDFVNSDYRHESCIVHGHTPSHNIEVLSHRIGLDVGAYATNQLGCIVLQDTQQSVLYQNTVII